MNLSSGAISQVSLRGIFRRTGNSKDKGKSLSYDTIPAPSEDSTFEVNLVDGETLNVDLDRLRQNLKNVYESTEILVLDVVKEICKKKEIAPDNAGFFGIRCEFSSGTTMWLVQTKEMAKVMQEKKMKFHFRLQFKVLCGQSFGKRDPNVYDYYLKQCRYDFKTGAFSKQLEGKDNEKILLRIIILEMMMLYQEVSKDEKVSQLKDILKSKYRKYFSIDEILKKYYDKDGPRDMARCRQKVEKSLNCFAKVTEPDKDFMTEIELLSNFKVEIFHLNKYERAGSEPNLVEIWMSPKDIQKRVLISNVRHTYWSCNYAELHQVKFTEEQNDLHNGEVKFMVIRGDEPPEVLYCPNDQVYESFCSFSDGYYRLLANQYNSIVNENTHYLLRNPCFGPIHRDEASRILSKKGERGMFLIREHRKYYGSYALTHISEEHDFVHIEILRQEEDNKKLYLCGSKNFESLEDLCKFYEDPKNSEEIKGTLSFRVHPKHAGSIPLYTDPANFRPVILPRAKTQVQSIKPVSQIVMLDDSDLIEDKILKQKGSFGKVNISRTRDGQELVVKRLETIRRDDLLDLYRTLKGIQHHCLVGLVAISIEDSFLAYEYVVPLEQHLTERRNSIQYGLLLKYLVQITNAIDFLHSRKYIHGDLSIANIYLHDTTSNLIKLGGSCVKWKLNSYRDLRTCKRFNFFPPELILNINQDYTEMIDIWAFGLTIWQLFTLDQPFRNYNYDQLSSFFTQHMDANLSKQPSLIYLNMHNMPFCSPDMFNMLNECLRMDPENRSSIDDIKMSVDEISKLAASKDKKKNYFTHDWKDQHLDNDYPILSVAQNNNQFSFDMLRQKHAMETDAYTSASSLTMKNGDSMISIDPDLSLVKLEHPERMDETCCEHDEDDGMYSPQHSPSRAKMKRSNSSEDGDPNRGGEDLETAEILVGLSETSHLSGEKSMSKTTTSQAPISAKDIKIEETDEPRSTSGCMMSTQLNHTSKVGTFSLASSSAIPPLLSNSSSLQTSISLPLPSDFVSSLRDWVPTSIKPRTSQFAPLPFLPASLPAFTMGLPPQFSSRGLSTKTMLTERPRKSIPHDSPQNPPTLPQQDPERSFSSLPPDSPESVRREYPPERAKRDTVKSDRTRLYLQERINKERDRFHGKRSLSFTDEFEEYKNNTIKAAKRALLGPNPFNIGVQLPADFLLRTDKRMSSDNERTLPADLKVILNNANNVKQKQQLNDMDYIPVQTILDMRKNKKLDPPDPRDTHLREKMANMKTHSPGPLNSEDRTSYIREPILSNPMTLVRPHATFPTRSIPYSLTPHIPTTRPLTSHSHTPLTPHHPPIQLGFPERHPHSHQHAPMGHRQPPHEFKSYRPLLPPSSHRPPIQSAQQQRIVDPTRSPVFHHNHAPMPQRKDVEPQSHYEKDQPNVMPHFDEGFRHIEKKSLIEEKKLGTGAFGEVWKGIWKLGRSNVNVAIKRLLASDEPNKKAIEDIHIEAKNLATLSKNDDPASRHIITLYGLCLDDTVYQIVEEYAIFGQLDSYIQRNKEHIKEGDILNYCKQVAVGMAYMHTKNVIHRDLACRNILVTSHTHIKISDFGMSRQPNKEYYRVRDAEKAKVPIRWCAIESITKNTYSTESDRWSYGVAAWEMYTVYSKDYKDTRAKPYTNVPDQELIKFLDAGNRLPQPPTCPDEVWKKMYLCWNVDPKQRPTFNEFKIFLNKTMKDIQYST